MSIVEKVEQAVENGVKAVEKFFTGEVEGAAGEVEQAGEKIAEDAAGAVEGEAGNVAKAVETPSTEAAVTGVASEAEPASQTGLTTSPAA